MKNRILGLMTSFVFVYGLASCGAPSKTDETKPTVGPVGTASISIPLTSDECNVTTATATINGDQLESPLVEALVVDATINGTIDDVPVGNVSIVVQAFDAGNLEVYAGEATASITENTLTNVTVVLGRNFENCPLAQPTGSLAIGGLLANDMTYIPSGAFKYGPSDGIDNWTSEETTGSYLIDIYEVTAAQYEGCVNDGWCYYGATGSESDYADYFNYNNDKYFHPINFVNWQEAADYCTYVGKRLPSQHEWEKAARGTDGRTHPWGEDDPSCANAVLSLTNGGNVPDWGCGNGSTMEVGSKPAGVSPYGALDMIGNVWEWTDSWYDEAQQSQKVIRGFGFDLGGSDVISGGSISYDFYSENPALRFLHIGFRCAL